MRADGGAEQETREPPMDEPNEYHEPGAEDVVPIESLEYQGDEALERAEALRLPLEDAIIAGEPPGPIIDELFDLIRLGRQ